MTGDNLSDTPWSWAMLSEAGLRGRGTGYSGTEVTPPARMPRLYRNRLTLADRLGLPELPRWTITIRARRQHEPRLLPGGHPVDEGLHPVAGPHRHRHPRPRFKMRQVRFENPHPPSRRQADGVQVEIPPEFPQQHYTRT